MKLTILGTGNALVSDCYNTCFVISDSAGEDSKVDIGGHSQDNLGEHGAKHFMVDAGGGNGILTQLKSAGINWKDIRHIFVTHKHLDHIMGIIWMVRMICQNMRMDKYDGDAWIYGHEEVIELVRSISSALIQEKDIAMLDTRLHLVVVEDGETRNIIGHDVTFFDIGSTKAKQFGFTMKLNDNDKLTCCGDEPFCEIERDYAYGSKWLLHEAFCLYSERDTFKPYEKNHSTVKDACELANTLDVKNIVLYHTEEKNLKDRRRLYTEEGKQYFDGNIFVPDDLDVIEL